MLVAFFYYSNRLFEVALISFDYLNTCDNQFNNRFGLNSFLLVSLKGVSCHQRLTFLFYTSVHLYWLIHS